MQLPHLFCKRNVEIPGGLYLQFMKSRYPFLKGAVIREPALFQHISRVVEMASNILRAVCIGADCDDLTAFLTVLTDEFSAGMLFL